MRYIIVVFFISMNVCCLDAKANVLDNPSHFLKTFKGLNKYLAKEDSIHTFIGVGASPVGFLSNRYVIGISPLSWHYIDSTWDLELIGFSFGFAFSQNSVLDSNLIRIRTFPKYRFTEMMSLGIVIGYEFISFPNALFEYIVNINEGGATLNQPFSTSGFIFGVGLSELIPLDKFIFKVNQVIYTQTYSTQSSNQSLWNYSFQDPALSSTGGGIQATWVFNVEFELLF